MLSCEISIRRAKIGDCDDIFAIESACFSSPWSKQSFSEQIDNPNADIFVGVADDTIVGFVNVTLVVGELTINNIAVMPDYRKQGVADRLLDAVFAEYANAECCLLEVRASNTPAQKLYKKHGFCKVGERKAYYQNPVENALLMTKDMKNG
ncbi:MAG: ribosomal protein S18-alanine N-acetyltransferase [Ruminococcus sp.]|nr:ribosomal protein S18-alanine N-acetyltransferase [Ruminococcus sp.]